VETFRPLLFLVWLAAVALPACRTTKTPPPPAVTPSAAGGPAEEEPEEGPLQDEEKPPADGSFALTAFGAESIDPAKVAESAGDLVVHNLFEGLLTYPAGAGDPVPGMALRYEVSPDGTVYTFHLRDGATWSDGKPVTSDDFRWTWLRKLAPETASRSAEHLWFIKGGKPYNQGKVPDPGRVGIETPDPKTLIVTLEYPLPYFKWFVAGSHYAPSPRAVVEKHKDKWTRPENIQSNGPYVLEEWKLRERMVLRKNPRYWDAAKVSIEKVVIYDTDSDSTSLNWYETGKVHWVQGTVPLSKVRLFREQKRSDFHLIPILCVYYYAFRTDRKPFDDVRVRRAFDMAVDKERLVRHVLGGEQRPATHLIPEMFEDRGYKSPAGAAFDPEAARALLAEAGYPRGVGLPKVDLLYNTFEHHRMIAEFVQRSLKENLGVQVNIQNMEWKSLLKRVRGGEYQLARFGWCGLNDPYSFVKILRSDSPNNHTGWRKRELDRLLDDALRTGDEPARLALLARAEAMISDEQPIMPMYFYTRPYLLKPYVCGFEDNPEDVHLFKYLSYEPNCTRGVNKR